jgi:type VI protein secretion system component VasF
MRNDNRETNPKVNDVLAAATDAILAGGNVDAVLNRYDVPRTELEGLLKLITRLHVALVGVKPSKRFAHRLKQDLMGAPRASVITRIRHLPPRVQIAAGVALLAGFMLIARRRLINDARQLPAESQEARA